MEKCSGNVEEPVDIEAAEHSRNHQDQAETGVDEQARIDEPGQMFFVSCGLKL